MRAAIIYWSGTGNTEMMANLIAQGIEEHDIEADVLVVGECTPEMVDSYDLIALGCPSMGDEELEESEFEPFYQAVEGHLKAKKVALFGSYGWGDGEWMRSWMDQVRGSGAELFDEGLIVQYTPEGSDIELCKEFGQRFAQA